MIEALPIPGDIVNASATAAATSMATVPAGRWFTADIQLSATLTGLGTGTPNVTYVVPGGATSAAPANGSVLARLAVGSTLGVSATTSSTTEILVYGGDAGGPGCTLNFSMGGASAASVTINGFLI